MKIIWASCGLLSLCLGIIGILLPLLPTVPFLLLAAFCFARSSPALHKWLIEHPTLGPPIMDWQATGSIRRSAKWMATGSILTVFLVSVLIGLRIQLLVVQAGVLACVLLFIWSRPEHVLTARGKVDQVDPEIDSEP